ncbi:uncharacterized protein SCHCODRAFT_02536198 [Schizophyllum commune H4-8]|nr:uncharacterized protein SCHCODRAFT_02536198 [Schizophyllum commune H4-8]KAI5895316.1 hypothetical protein SCHCODRAFT_02536198 [Schizophyllum commune H4-8]
MDDEDDGLSAARLELCEHIQSLPEIPISEFMGYYMPPSPVDVDSLVDKLAQRSQVLIRKKGFTQHPSPLSSSGMPNWAAFIESPEARATSGEYEKDVFADMESIAAQIVECCRDIAPHLQPTYQLRSNDTRNLYGHVYTYAHPDGPRVLVGMKPSGGFVAPSEEYEPRLCNAVDNYQEIVWNMHQTMRSDYTRRFVFGVTIHNTSVRLWHMNRELFIVSNSFDMYKDYRTFADMHARFAFASRDELGYDHTMTKLHPNLPKDERYRVRVGGEYYITTQVLENYAAQDNFGRCTRIFRAYKEDDDSRDAKFAIKDGWLGRESQLEVDVYNAIMAGVEAHDWSQYSAPPKDVSDFVKNVKKWEEVPPVDFKHGTNVDRKQFFMPIIAGERVKARNGRDDDTRAVIARGYSDSSHRRQFLSLTKASTTVDFPAASKAASARTSRKEGVEGDKKKAAEPSTTPGIFAQPTAPRVHHRSVMLLATPLDKIQSVKQAFSTLSDATYGLFILHCLKYCHRDISPYNIFSVDRHGVLGDFEYTTHAAATAQPSRMTGTPNFMAVEVMTGTFMVDRHTANDSDFIEAIFARRHLNSMPEDVWEYSSVHDLESVWWIALWLLFCHTLQLPFLAPPYDVEVHESKYRELFPGRVVIAQPRFDHLKDARTLIKTLSVLPPVCTDTVQAPLYLIRNYLMRYYQRLDVNSPPHPLMWWMIGHLLCQSRGQQIGGDFVSFTSPQRAGSLPPENEVDQRDEDDDSVAKVPPPCSSHRSGMVLFPQHETAHSDEEGDKRLHIGAPVIAKRSFSWVDDETLKEDGDSDSKEAHRAEKKRRQAEL